MSDEISAQLLALYRDGAREVPDEKLDDAVLGKARAVAWRRRNRVFLLAASCASLALTIGILSTVPTRDTRPAVDTSQYGMTDGPKFYAMTANAGNDLNTDEPGMNANPGFTGGMWTKSNVKSGEAL